MNLPVIVCRRHVESNIAKNLNAISIRICQTIFYMSICYYVYFSISIFYRNSTQHTDNVLKKTFKRLNVSFFPFQIFDTTTITTIGEIDRFSLSCVVDVRCQGLFLCQLFFLLFLSPQPKMYIAKQSIVFVLPINKFVNVHFSMCAVM